MKRMKFVLAAALFLGSMLNAGAQDGKSEKRKKTERVVFHVDMHCHNCQAKIEKNIPWEKGVKDLKVDLESKTVAIDYDPKKTSEETLRKAIEKLDFQCEKHETEGGE
jgi:copper chaperone CopZ